MHDFTRRFEGELDFTIPRAWPTDAAATDALERRARLIASIVAQAPPDAFSGGVARNVVLDAVSGLEALWPSPGERPIEVATAIAVMRDA